METIIVAYIIGGFTICCAMVCVAFCIIFTKMFDQQLWANDKKEFEALELQFDQLEKLVKTNYFEYRMHKHAVLKKGKV